MRGKRNAEDTEALRRLQQILFFSSTNSVTADAGLFAGEPRFTVANGPNGRARTPLFEQDADRTRAKSSRASQIGVLETLTPLPDVPDAGTLVAAVPVQRDRRSMSRRPGQNGRIEKRGGSFSLLFYRDVPGTTKRERVRRTLQATTMVAAKQEAQRIIDTEGVNTAAHLEASCGPVVTFGRTWFRRHD